MDEQIPIEQPKKRGWPKGKLRGPRKPKPQPPPPPPPEPFPQQPPEPSAYEPVTVSGVMSNGSRFNFRANDFSPENGRYTFFSFPAMRGFKTVTILRSDQLAMLEITAPETMMEKLKAAPAPIAVAFDQTPPTAAGGPPIIYGPNPTLVRPPYDGGDPRRAVKDPRAEHAATVPNPAGIPMAQLSKGEDGVPDRTMATMG